MHNMGELVVSGRLGPLLLDLGHQRWLCPSDVLINALHQLRQEVVEIRRTGDRWGQRGLARGGQADALFPLVTTERHLPAQHTPLPPAMARELRRLGLIDPARLGGRPGPSIAEESRYLSALLRLRQR